MKEFLFFISLFIIATITSCQPDRTEKGDDLMQKIAQYAETTVTYDESLLDERQKVVVQKLYQAAKIIDEIFLDQVYSKNLEIRDQLLNAGSVQAKNELSYFNINFGPFDRLAERHPFIGTTAQPLGANFYPEDMTKEEFEAWLKDHPEDRAAFISEFTVIRRKENKLIAIPYSEYYKDQLTKVNKLLNEAAESADNSSLKHYLTTRAEALHTNDYYESDMAWMDLKDHTIEVIIGPYEVYEDRLFNYKAAFECFITIKDPVESKKLDVFTSFLNEMEENLPIPDDYKNFNRGSESPMVVVQEVFSAGDTKAGVQTLAFNLPNDERVREAKGSKKVMLKNIHEAKFAKLLMPIAKKILDPEQLPQVSFDGFFNHTLMHEMSHGVGPGKIRIDGRDTEVKIELKETYSKLEECKADVLGIYNNIFMIDKKIYPPESEREFYVTFLPGAIRSIRFGIDEAHGAGNAIIFNYFLEKEIYEYNAEKEQVRVNLDKVADGVKELSNKLLMIQAKGDYDGAVALINKYAVDSEPIKALRAKLKDLPVDIWPVFQIEK